MSLVALSWIQCYNKTKFISLFLNVVTIIVNWLK